MITDERPDVGGTGGRQIRCHTGEFGCRTAGLRGRRRGGGRGHPGSTRALTWPPSRPACPPSARSPSPPPPRRAPTSPRSSAVRGAGADRLPAPVRCGLRRGQGRRRRRNPRCPAPPSAAPRWIPLPAVGLHQAGSGGIFRDCAVHDFDTVRWITNQEAVEVYATGSVQVIRCSPSTAMSTPPRWWSVRRRCTRGDLQRPDTTAAAMTADWRCTASRTPSPSPGITASRCATSIRALVIPGSPRECRTTSSWDRFTEAFRTELAASSTWCGAARSGSRRRRRRRGRLDRRGSHRILRRAHRYESRRSADEDRRSSYPWA